jgi:hypothetical protein
VIEHLEGLATSLSGVERRDEGGTVTFLCGSLPFVVVEGGTAEFRLDPTIAAAAAGTPNAAASARGREWVTFSPPELDRFAIDRAVAWFESAWRRAER